MSDRFRLVRNSPRFEPNAPLFNQLTIDLKRRAEPTSSHRLSGSEIRTMKQDKRRILAPLVIALSGIAIGALCAIVGLAIGDWNVSEHGASYSRYRHEVFALPALPGIIISERRFGMDFQLGEIQFHQASVIGWNALVYGTIASSGFLFQRFLTSPSERAGSTTSKSEQQDDAH